MKGWSLHRMFLGTSSKTWRIGVISITERVQMASKTVQILKACLFNSEASIIFLLLNETYERQFGIPLPITESRRFEKQPATAINVKVSNTNGSRHGGSKKYLLATTVRGYRVMLNRVPGYTKDRLNRWRDPCTLNGSLEKGTEISASGLLWLSFSHLFPFLFFIAGSFLNRQIDVFRTEISFHIICSSRGVNLHGLEADCGKDDLSECRGMVA